MTIQIPEWLFYGGLGCVVGALGVFALGWWATHQRRIVKDEWADEESLKRHRDTLDADIEQKGHPPFELDIAPEEREKFIEAEGLWDTTKEPKD